MWNRDYTVQKSREVRRFCFSVGIYKYKDEKNDGADEFVIRGMCEKLEAAATLSTRTCTFRS